jgi:hypothetical protein
MDENQNQFEEIPHVFSPSVKRQRKPLPKRTTILIAVVILIIIVFIFTRISGSSKKEVTSSPTPFPTITESPTMSPESSESPTPSPSESPSPTPSPTPKPSVDPVDKTSGLDRSKLSIRIENGSGEAGVANKASDYLTGLGYTVSSTGNAGNFDYTNVTIQVKSASSDFLSLLKKDLGFNYTIGSSSSDLPDSASEDALVIIGK